MTAPVTSSQGSPEPSPAAAFQTVIPASKDVSSAEACADREEMTGEAVAVSGSGDVLKRRIATPEEVRLPLQHG